MYKKIIAIAMVAVLTAITASADVVMNSILDPATQSADRSNLNAPGGQTFTTGTLVSNDLSFIEIQAPRDTLDTTPFNIAVYNDTDQNAATWDPGTLVGISSATNFTALNAVSRWNFSGEVLSDSTVYAYKLVTDAAATNDLDNMRVGFEKDGSATTEAIHGGAPFGSGWDCATKIKTGLDEEAVLPTIIEFLASETNVLNGTTVTLSWQTLNEDTLTLLPGVGDVTGSTSNDVVITTDITYSLIAANDNGSVTNTVDIEVVAGFPPTIPSFEASETSVLSNTTVTLSWETEGEVDTLTLLPGVGDVTGDTSNVVTITTNITYTLIASNAFGSDTNTAAITVIPPAPDATVVWRRDWEKLSHDTPIDDSNLDGGPVSDVEVGTQDFTVVSGPVRIWNEASVGGHDLISTSSGGLFEAIIEITDVQYAAFTELGMDFVIGTGSSGSKNGDWFVEYGTMSGGTFTVLPGVDSGSASYSFAGEVPDYFGSDSNPSELFGYNVGGKTETLIVDPTDAVNGQNVAIRIGIDSSNQYAGFSDMALYSTGLSPDEIGEITINTIESGDVTISWDTTDGQAYNVETNRNMIFQDWGVLESKTGTGGNITVTSATEQAELFYKVTSSPE